MKTKLKLTLGAIIIITVCVIGCSKKAEDQPTIERRWAWSNVVTNEQLNNNTIYDTVVTYGYRYTSFMQDGTYRIDDSSATVISGTYVKNATTIRYGNVTYAINELSRNYLTLIQKDTNTTGQGTLVTTKTYHYASN